MARTPKVTEDRREQILDAALRVFARQGFAKATNKEIAHEAGITPGLIYYYFESKEALLKALLEARSPVRLIESLPPEAQALPPAAFLRMMGRQALALMEGEEMSSLIRIMLSEMLHTPDFPPIVALFVGRAIGALTSYLEAKVQSGEIRQLDTQLLAQIFAGSLMSFVLRRHILRDPLALALSQEQVVDAIVDTVLQGIAPR